MELKNWVRVHWDRAGAVFAVVVGLLCLILGYRGVADTEYVAKQIPFVISGGIFGIFLLGTAATLWVTADLRDEWRELRGIRLLLRENLDYLHGAGSGDRAVQLGEPGIGQLADQNAREANSRSPQLAAQARD